MSGKADYINALPREAQEARGKIRMYPSGRYVNPLELRASDIDIQDIAHHLSQICRYTGGSPYHYSVAQHSLYVSDRMLQTYNNDKRMGLAGLLHDASEAYLNDMASPVKHDPRMSFYREIEHNTGKLIFATFGLDQELLDLTKPLDDELFFREVRGWFGQDTELPFWPDQRSTAEIFLNRFKWLGGRRVSGT